MVCLLFSVIVDDLIQVGMIGLLEVVKNFDGSKGVSFEIFVGICICGVMFDEIRKGDWMLCLVYKNGWVIFEVIVQVEREMGCDVWDVDIVEKFNVSLVEYYQMLFEVNVGKLVGIEDLGVLEDVIIMEDLCGFDVLLDDLM